MKREFRTSILARSSVLAISMAVSLLSGCGEVPSDAGDVTAEESAIIGGSTLTVANRRTLGLVDVSSPLGSCSGALVSPHMVLTATHCLDLTTGSNNTFSIPRTDGVLETRVGGTISRVGTTDLTLVSLQTSNVVQQWPILSRSVARNAPSSLVKQNVACYGRGSSAYANPSGLIVDGLWRILNTTFDSMLGSLFIIKSVNGNQILAPGDSGGPCLYNSQIAAVSSAGSWVCANQANCEATITYVNDARVAATQPYADYIDFAASRSATTFAPITLAPGWTNAPFSTNNAGYAVFDGAVHLRGAIATTGTAALAFTLPSSARPTTDVYVPINLCASKKGRLFIRADGTATVSAAGGDWAAAQCFTSLEGVSFVRSSAFDTQLSLQNQWIGGVYGRAPAAKVTNGVVRLSGSMSEGTASGVFTLPPGFRPGTRVYLPVDTCNATKGRLVIEPNGDSTVFAEGNFSDAQCFTSLDSVTFVAANSANLTPLNGWVGAPYSTRAPGAKNVSGIVRFQGAVTTTGTNAQLLTLPAPDRPATMVYIPVDLCSAAKGRLLVYPDGRVTVQSAGTFSQAQCFTSLEGASFGI